MKILYSPSLPPIYLSVAIFPWLPELAMDDGNRMITIILASVAISAPVDHVFPSA
jgi:hypothetical protein